jgi:hypothetical protein
VAAGQQRADFGPGHRPAAEDTGGSWFVHGEVRFSGSLTSR